jgi:hypothetical protein
MNGVNEPNFRFYFRQPVLESGIGYFKHDSPQKAIINYNRLNIILSTRGLVFLYMCFHFVAH